MSIQDIGNGDASVKTLGIRLKGRLHSQVTLVAQLRGTSINDEVVEALDAHVNRITSDPLGLRRPKSCVTPSGSAQRPKNKPSAVCSVPHPMRSPQRRPKFRPDPKRSRRRAVALLAEHPQQHPARRFASRTER